MCGSTGETGEILGPDIENAGALADRLDYGSLKFLNNRSAGALAGM